jgi:hypothetical protein
MAVLSGGITRGLRRAVDEVPRVVAVRGGGKRPDHVDRPSCFFGGDVPHRYVIAAARHRDDIARSVPNLDLAACQAQRCVPLGPHERLTGEARSVFGINQKHARRARLATRVAGTRIDARKESYGFARWRTRDHVQRQNKSGANPTHGNAPRSELVTDATTELRVPRYGFSLNDRADRAARSPAPEVLERAERQRLIARA